MDHMNAKSQLIRNEFALVRISMDESANGMRLLIEDMATGNFIYLDPLELEALTRADHEDFRPLVGYRREEVIPLDDLDLRR